MQNVVTVAAAFTIAFVFGSLKMALVLLGVLPLMAFGSFAQMRALRQNTDASQAAIAQAGGVAVQAITGIRTVTAFNMSPKLLALYSAALRRPMLLGIRNALLRGLTLGVSQFVTLAAYGLLFWYGTTLVLDAPPEQRGEAFQRMLRSLMAVTMSAQGIGQNTSFLGDQAAANSAAARIFTVVDRKPAIDSTGEGGEVLEKVEGRIEFKRVDFTYPARPEQRIFRRFGLTVGKCVGRVGCAVGGWGGVVGSRSRTQHASTPNNTDAQNRARRWRWWAPRGAARARWCPSSSGSTTRTRGRCVMCFFGGGDCLVVGAYIVLFFGGNDGGRLFVCIVCSFAHPHLTLYRMDSLH